MSNTLIPSGNKELRLEHLCTKLKDLEDTLYNCSIKVEQTVDNISGTEEQPISQENESKDSNASCIIYRIEDMISKSVKYIKDISGNIDRL